MQRVGRNSITDANFYVTFKCTYATMDDLKTDRMRVPRCYILYFSVAQQGPFQFFVAVAATKIASCFLREILLVHNCSVRWRIYI